MKILEWPRGPVILLTLSIVLFVLPQQWKGPDLVEVNGGEALSLLNTLAVIPLLISAVWIQKGLWARRIYLFNKITIYPGSASLLIFFIGIGLGLLIASAFGDFSYWWAVGGLLFITLLGYIVLTSGRSMRS